MTKHTLESAARQIADANGGGWILGNAGIHDRLVRELEVGTNGWRQR